MTPEEITTINRQCAERLGMKPRRYWAVWVTPDRANGTVKILTYEDAVKVRDKDRRDYMNWQADPSRIMEPEEYDDWSHVPDFYALYDNAAELCVQKALEWGWDFQSGSNSRGFYCLFEKPETEESAEAPTLPAAIALCFLKLPVPTL